MDMKKKLWLLIVTTLVTNAALHAQSPPAELLASRIADRMRDSLSLSAGQRTSIYTINMQLHERKMNVRQQHASAPGEWGALIQRIENTRDSLYRPLLGEEKYLLYRQKKHNLVTN